MGRLGIGVLCGVMFLLAAQGSMGRNNSALKEQFLNPPDEAKPWVYWFWMDGNVTREGITADLEAMDRVGIGGALMMGVGLRTPPGKANFNSPLWRDLYLHAAEECGRLGLKLTLHQCDGWATSGGPWIDPPRSMKQLVWTTQEIEGSSSEPIRLEQPFTKEDFYEDVALLAVPVEKEIPLEPSHVTVNGKADGSLFDGDLKTGVRGEADVLVTFDMPQDLSTVVFERNDRWNYNMKFESLAQTLIELSENGKDFEPVAEFDYNVSHKHGNRFSLTASFPQQTVKAVRIHVENKRPLLIPEISLYPEPRTHLWEVKSSLARRRDHGGESPWLDAAPRPGTVEGVDPSQTIDLSDELAGDGTLDWKVPVGYWRIIRVGMTSTGKHVAPRTNAGTGLEADKMGGEAVRYHFDSFAKGMIADHNIAEGDPIISVHVDSWESMLHTWSSRFAEEFKMRRGYAITPWLPVLTGGMIIGSAEESERFLWDVRRTMADLIAENFYGALREKCRESGVLFQSEAAGRQMFMYDPLNYAAKTDIYVGEFWMNSTTRVDCRIAASAAHTYGRPLAAAEAFTSFHGGFRNDLFDLKVTGDQAFCTGINRFIVHRYTMQPFTNAAPGLTFGPYGINFERTQTWWENGAKAWCEYVARCQALLQTGTFVADVIHYIGHDAPNYLGHRHELWNPIPAGYDYDGCNLEILKQIQVEADGMLSLPSGMRYRVLLLPNREHMVLDAAREIERLVDAGAVVIGPKPLRTPGLKNWRENDAALAQITARIWGKVLDAPIEKLLNAMAPPDFDYTAEATLNYIHRRTDDADLYFVANTDPTNGVDAVLRFRVTGRIPELWDASTGKTFKPFSYRERDGITELPVHFDPAGSWFFVFRKTTTTATPLPLGGKTVMEISGPWTVSFPPNGQAPESIELPQLASWTEHTDPGVRYFSGTATYSTQFQYSIPHTPYPILLDLGKVKNIAEVTLNGKNLSVLWKPPFKVDISDAIQEGQNQLEIKVTNLWPNRLIGDARLHPDPGLDYRLDEPGKPISEPLAPTPSWSATGPLTTIPDWVRNGGKSPVGRTSFVLWGFYGGDEPLMESGLLGPIWIETNK